MKNYEKPMAELIDFAAEEIMDAGVGGGASFGEDVGDAP